MSEQEKTEILEIISKCVNEYGKKDGRIGITSLGNPALNKVGTIDYKKYGAPSLHKFLKTEFADDLEFSVLKKKGTDQVQYFVRLKNVDPTPKPQPPRRSESTMVVDEADKYPTAFYEWYEYQTGDDERFVSAFRREKWSFGDVPSDFAANDAQGFVSKYPILARYLEYTFLKLSREGKICYLVHRRSQKQQVHLTKYAVFCTGLVNDSYDMVYALFTYSASNRKWRLFDFITAGDAKYPELIAAYEDLPEPADYYSGIRENLYFDPTMPYKCDTERLLKALHLLPREFLERCLGKEFLKDSKISPDEAYKLPPLNEKRVNYFSRLYEKLCDDSNRTVLNRMANELQYAVSLSFKRAVYDRSNITAQYVPDNDLCTLLMPLCLCDIDNPDGKADLALVVSCDGSTYRCTAVITLRRAYISSRVIAHNKCEWLEF